MELLKILAEQKQLLPLVEKVCYYSGSSNSVPENIPQVPLRIHAVPESTSSVITSSCLGFTVR